MVCDRAIRRQESWTPTVRTIEAGLMNEGHGYATWRSRGTSDWLLIYTIDGCGRFGSSQRTVLAPPATMTLIEPGTPHDYGVERELEHWELAFAHFHPRADWLPLLDWPEALPGIRQLWAGGRIAQRVQTCLEEAARFTRAVLDHHELFALNALEQALLWANTQNPNARALDERILRAMEMVERRLSGPLTIGELASASTLSVSRFAHMFRAQVGLSPQQFIELQRLARAKQMLELTARPVSVVARQSGFESPSYFATRFRRHHGMSPSEYRVRSRPRPISVS